MATQRLVLGNLDTTKMAHLTEVLGASASAQLM